MSEKIYLDVSRRHDLVLLFDVKDGNPNGDPDAGNLPRVDPETMHGLVTDVCLKRKVRDWVDMTRGDQSRMKIYVQHQGILAREQKRAYEAIGAEPGEGPNMQARAWMCQNFFDVRMFGAVMTVGKAERDAKDGKSVHWNCGQVRGPMQLTFARSVDPVTPLDLSITRVALTNAGDTGRGGEDDDLAASGQMGRKALLPYALYIGYGFFTPFFATRTKVTSEDLQIFWEALQNMWEVDRSAGRGMMACRGIYIFSHEKPVGNAPAHELFERVTARAVAKPPRNFRDYEVVVNDADLPAGVTLTRLVG